MLPSPQVHSLKELTRKAEPVTSNPHPETRSEPTPQDAETLAGELNHPDAQELLTTQTLTRLAYTGLDGFPRVIPIGFHWNGQQVVVCTAPISPKVRALAARPQVALTIDTDDGTASQALLIRGVASIDIVDGIPSEYLAASTKSMAGEQARQFEAQVRSVYKQMARIAIEPRWVRYYDFGTGRIPGFLRKLVGA
jgi:hypothetical protein